MQTETKLEYQRFQGKVDFAGRSKFNDEDFTIKLDGDDNWYRQKREWLDVVPSKGDVIDLVVKGKYIRRVEVLENAERQAPTFDDLPVTDLREAG